LSQEESRLQTLGSLLQIEQDVRQAESESAVEFIAVNDTWRIVPYRQAVLWRRGFGQRPVVKLVSGLAALPGDSPYRQWLTEVIHLLAAQTKPGKALLATAADIPEELRAGWQEWTPEMAVLLVLPAPRGQDVGGLWLAVENIPGDAELALLERLAWAYGQALWAWRPHAPVWQGWREKLKSGRRRKQLALAVLVLALFPMRLTALAPAETIGKDAKLIAAPADGVVGKFFVDPNQPVKAGEILFTLDDTTFRNRYEVTEKARAVAQADYLRATQKSFSDEASKAELASLRARFEEKAAETQYTKDLFERIQVESPGEGIVVYSDPNDWLGKPVQTGERIALLADPRQVQIAIHLPVDDAISLDIGSPVRLYLNISPLGSIDGVLVQASYEPAPEAEGFVAYRLKADLAPGETPPRIGLKGTAKVYGSWAPLIYHVLRKPLAALRRMSGI